VFYVYLSIYLSVYLFIYLFICLFHISSFYLTTIRESDSKSGLGFHAIKTYQLYSA